LECRYIAAPEKVAELRQPKAENIDAREYFAIAFIVARNSCRPEQSDQRGPKGMSYHPKPGCPRRRGAWAVSLVAAVSLVIFGLGHALAQGIATTAPPVHSSVDANGVDLITGALVISSPQLSIGQGEGALTYTRQLTASGWLDNVTGTVSFSSLLSVCTTLGTTTVSFGGNSEAFTWSGSAYVNSQGGGSTLTCNTTTQKYTYTTADGVVVVFGQFPAFNPSWANGGRVISATSPDGLALTYSYNTVTVAGTSASRLQSVNNNLGYQLKLTYALDTPLSAGDLTAWTTVASVTGVNNAIEYCSPTAFSCSYAHSWPSVTYVTGNTNQNIVVTDPLANQSTFTYTTSGQLVGIQRPGSSGNTTSITYNASNQAWTVSNSAAVVGPSGSGAGVWTYIYSAGGGVETTTVTDPNGHARQVVSNQTTNLVTSDTIDPGTSPHLNLMTSYLYDSYGRPTQVTLPAGDQYKYTYDQNTNVRGNVTQTTHVAVGGSPTISTFAAFDATCGQPSKCNKPNTTTDANNNITNYAYSPTTGQLTTITGPPPTVGAVRPVTTLTYTSLYAYFIQTQGGGATQAPSAVGLATGASTCQTLASCSGTADQVVTTIAYGSSGVANNRGPTSVTTAAGNGSLSATASQTFDNYGNVATTVGPLGSAQTTAYFYDLNRDLLGGIGPLATGQTTYPAVVNTWSPNGQVTQVAHGTAPNQASLASVTILEQQNVAFDALGRQVQASFVSGGTTQTLTQWTWDSANRLVCVATRMNSATFASPPPSACVTGASGAYGSDRITYNTYDAADRLTTVTLGYLSPQQENYASLTYTANGAVQSIADANQNLTTVVYDTFQRPSKVEYPSPTTRNQSNVNDYEGLTFDNNGNLTVDRRRSGDTVTVGYDALNRAINATFSANSAQNYTTSYDLLNRPLTVAYTTSGATSLTYVWDALSRLSSANIAGGGEPTGGRRISYGYDAAGDRTGITWPDTGSNALTITYLYDVLQRVTTIQANGTTVAAYAYDSHGRRSTITRAGGSGAATSYGYDGADRISSLVQSLTGTGAVTYTLGYDPSNALVSRLVNNGTYSWHPGSGTTPYVANGLNQYTSVSGTALSYTDGRANLTALSPSGPTFTYDTSNDLLTASGPTSVALAYDPTGRIQTKTAGGATSTFLYAGQMLIGEYDSAGNILARYVPGPSEDEAALWYSGSGTATPQWLHSDAQGSIIAWSNATGGSLGTQAYDPWGLPQAWNGSRYAYTGQLAIGEAQLYHYKARAYDPALGRFLQTDPAGYQSDANPYAYVGNDPLDGVDPSGMESSTTVGDVIVQAIRPPSFDTGPWALAFSPAPLVLGLQVFSLALPQIITTVGELQVTAKRRVHLPDLSPLTFYRHFLTGQGDPVCLTGAQFSTLVKTGQPISRRPRRDGTIAQETSYYGTPYAKTFGTSTLILTKSGNPIGFHDYYDFDIHARASLQSQVETAGGAAGYLLGGKNFDIDYNNGGC
jgi:RHS repeat-associated protein